MLTGSNLLTIDTEQAANLLNFFVRSGGNIFLYGQSGIGKSYLSREVVKACGFKINHINLSSIERFDLAGIPKQDDSDILSYKSPHYLPALKEGEAPSAVLLLDEADKAEHEMHAPMLEVLETRCINGKPLNIAACIVTANLANEGAFSKRMSSALLGRGAAYEMKFEFDRWLDWAKKNGVHDLVLGFLKANQDLCCGEPDTRATKFPSPRGWTQASDAIIKAKALKLIDEETIFGIVSGFVGQECGLKFKSWYELFRKFEPIALSLVERGVHPTDYENKWSPTEKMVFVITACYTARLKFVAASKQKPKYTCIERLCKWLETIEPELQGLGLNHGFPIETVVDPRWQLYRCEPFLALTTKLSNPA